MLSQDAVKVIARTGIANHMKKYVVILDNTVHDVSAEDLRSGDYTVIHWGNNYDKAVDITNFWDERQNVHLAINDVEKIRFELDIVKVLAGNDLTVPADHELFSGFAKLPTGDTINVMAQAARSRLYSATI